MKAIRPIPVSATHAHVETRFFPVPEILRAYVTTIYLTTIDVPPDTRIEDYLHPEWGNIRFIEGGDPMVAIGGAPEPAPHFIATGPTSRAAYLSAGPMRAWGIGLLPMGWAKYCPVPAHDMADRFCDGAKHPAFASLAPLGDSLGAMADDDAAAQAIRDYLIALLPDAPRDDPAILFAHQALIDDDLTSVADLAAKLGLSERSVERLSRRAFGFPPKLLLRRQRFLRSLARFMLDPSMAWIETLDYHYYDQAQFTRDFKRFMGMSPRAYAARPKPILGSAAIARAAAAGAAVQGLHNPAN